MISALDRKLVRDLSQMKGQSFAIAVVIAAGVATFVNSRTILHSLELTRRLSELVDTGWPVLVALSNKDFVGETLDLPVDDRLDGTLAATTVSAWLGARVFRAHQVRRTRRVLDMVASIRGYRPPAVARRGLA